MRTDKALFFPFEDGTTGAWIVAGSAVRHGKFCIEFCIDRSSEWAPFAVSHTPSEPDSHQSRTPLHCIGWTVGVGEFVLWWRSASARCIFLPTKSTVANKTPQRERPGPGPGPVPAPASRNLKTKPHEWRRQDMREIPIPNCKPRAPFSPGEIFEKVYNAECAGTRKSQTGLGEGRVQWSDISCFERCHVGFFFVWWGEK